MTDANQIEQHNTPIRPYEVQVTVRVLCDYPGRSDTDQSQMQWARTITYSQSARTMRAVVNFAPNCFENALEELKLLKVEAIKNGDEPDEDAST